MADQAPISAHAFVGLDTLSVPLVVRSVEVAPITAFQAGVCDISLNRARKKPQEAARGRKRPREAAKWR